MKRTRHFLIKFIPVLFAMIIFGCNARIGHEAEVEGRDSAQKNTSPKTAKSHDKPGEENHQPGEHAGNEESPVKDEHGHHDGHTEMLELDPDTLRDLRITVAKAVRHPESFPISATGELQPDPRVYAEVSSMVPSRVVGILVEPGQRIKSGQTLVELESVEVGQHRVQLAEASIRSAALLKDLERKRAIGVDGMVSQRELEIVETEYAVVEAARQAYSSLLQSIGAKNGEGCRFYLTAPISGTVLSRDVHLGEWLEPSHAAFRLAELTSLFVVTRIFERDVIHLRAEDLAHILPSALPGQRIEGRIFRIGAEVDTNSRTVEVTSKVSNVDGLLKPGMSAVVQFFSAPVEAKQVITVPLQAVQRVDEQWVVFSPTGAGRFAIHTIGRGRESGGEVEVLSGLDVGSQVVVEGAFVLKAAASSKDGGDAHHH